MSGPREGGGRSYRDLIAWQKAVGLTRRTYEITATWPRSETYGLSGQAQRAASSVPANIAEGQGFGTRNQFHHHLRIANGSLCELETHLIVASQLGYIDEQALNDVLSRSTEVARLLSGLMKSLR